MKTKTKALLISACAVLLIAALGFTTLAYLTDTDNATNTFTVGNVDITLDEAKTNGDAGWGDKVLEGQDRVVTNKYHLLPGHEYPKDPTVHVAKDSEDCYVRMFVTLNQSAEWDAVCDAHKGDDNQNLFGAGDIFYYLSNPDASNEADKYTKGYNTKWELQTDRIVENIAKNTRTYEFWYKGGTGEGNAKYIVPQKDTDTDLPALFDKLVMPKELTKEDLAKIDVKGSEKGQFKIFVYAEAIQTDGFANAEDAFDNGLKTPAHDTLIKDVTVVTP